MKSKIGILIIVLVAIATNVLAQKSPRSNSDNFASAQWISDQSQIYIADSLLYGDFPAPLFRKTFSTTNKVNKATLFITAAGYYCAYINGSELDQNYCDPAWTDFSKRIYYAEYDITNQLNSTINTIGVTIGNGFYNPLPMKMWGYLNLRKYLTIGQPMFIANIRLEYDNGKTENISTDKSWKFAYGPLIRNNVYFGEIYDARKEIQDWDKTSFNDTDWKQANERVGPSGKLQKTFFPYIQEIDVKKPIQISEQKGKKYLVDMGVNFTGTFKIKMHGQRGDTIRFRFGERIYPNGEINTLTAVAGQLKEKGKGGAGAPDLAEQMGVYIFGNNKDVWYSPIFSFRVYRYMEISGMKYQPSKDDIQGIALSTNVEHKNSFSCSSKLINSIQDASRRTFLSNLMSVQSDCPGREKFGYGGDLYTSDEAFITNFNMQTFYHKVLYDWVDAVNDSDFIDTAPFNGMKFCGISFEASTIELQDKLLKYYADTTFIREMYDFDLRWMKKVERIYPKGIVEKGLGDHESLVNVPVQLIGTASYLNAAQIMVKIASMMGDSQNKTHFEQLESIIKSKLLELYWNNTSTDYINQQSREASIVYINLLPEKEKAKELERLKNTKELFNKQTLYAVFLYFDILPEKDKKVALDSLLKAIDKAPAGHFTTGIFGTKYILEALSKNGYVDKVFNIVNSTTFPGWGFMVDHGATTLWETWKESDNVYSNCHPMFGSVSAWFYRYLAGIRPNLDNPGFKAFTIAPTIPSDLSHVNCEYNSPYGKIISNWKKEKNGNLIFNIEIPKGSIATIILPVKMTTEIKVQDQISKKTSKKSTKIFDLTSGEYIIYVNKQK
jgi:alpha-L-rhamnosidase